MGSTITHRRYDSEEIYDFRPEYIGILAEMVDEIKSGCPEKNHVNLYLSTDDEELSFEGIDRVFPIYNSKKSFDNSGHRFSRFPDIVDEIALILDRINE